MVGVLWFALAVLFLVLSVIAWASSVFALPGNWIVVLLALLYAWAEGFEAVTWWVLAIGVFCALIGEGIELMSSYIGARTSGAGRLTGIMAVVGCIIGAIAGVPFYFGLGAIPGTVLGAFVGAIAGEMIRRKKAGEALLAGLGAAVGRALGLTGKLIFGGFFLLLLIGRVILSALPQGTAAH